MTGYRTLYIGNLLGSSSPELLEKHFELYGGLNARIVPQHGFGFVDVLNEMADAAIKEMNQSRFLGHRITVQATETVAEPLQHQASALNLASDEIESDSIGTSRTS